MPSQQGWCHQWILCCQPTRPLHTDHMPPPPSQADAGSVWKVNSLEAVGPSTLAASADAAAGPELAGYAASVQQAAASTPATMVASTLSIIASINFTLKS